VDALFHFGYRAAKQIEVCYKHKEYASDEIAERTDCARDTETQREAIRVLKKSEVLGA